MKIKFFRRPPASEFPFSIGAPAMIWQVLFFYLPLGIIAISSFLQFSELDVFEGFTFQKITFFAALGLRADKSNPEIRK